MERSTRNLWRFSSLVAREMGRGTRYLPCGFQGNKGRTRRKKKKMSLSTTQRFPSPLSTFVPRLRILRADFSLFSPFHANLQAFRKLPSWKRTNFLSFPGRREGSKAREGTWSVDGRGITGKRIGGVGGRNGIPMEGA